MKSPQALLFGLALLSALGNAPSHVFAETSRPLNVSENLQDPSDFLDPPYKNLVHPKRGLTPESVLSDVQQDVALENELKQSDTISLIALQTSVKAQASRGTCSIFSATALLESLLISRGTFTPSLDLSEEWLEYLISEGRSSDGSTSWSNFRAFSKWGTVEEELMPYIGETWSSVDYSDLSKQRCEKAANIEACLIGHRDHALLHASSSELQDESSPLFDPEFKAVRDRAREFKSQHVKLPKFADYSVGTVEEVKRLLREGVPLTLDIDFYYGAWNHRTAPDHGINRDIVAFELGNVGYPEPGSVDIEASRLDPAGHSVLIVGYDDNAEITTQSLMQDGTTKTFTYKGVYYFKNSWGQGGFGKNFVLGEASHAGYGAITQKYAEEYGGFYQLPIKRVD